MKSESSNFFNNGEIKFFREFVHNYGLPNNHSSITNEEINKCNVQLPQQVLNFWKQNGFGSYNDSLIWTHPPSKFDPIIEAWLGLLPSQAKLIFRSSFGDFCIWSKGKAYLLDPNLGQIDELASDIDFLFDYILCREQFLRDVLRSEFHFQCIERLGQISENECFAFIPAKALGGSGTIDTVQRVIMREQLALLAQLVEPLSL